MKDLKILIACEESQVICAELRSLGYEAYSCDILSCSGGHNEWHIQEDVIPLLNGNCTFRTADGIEHTISRPWDLIIAHPPCTYLTTTGNRWFNVEKYGDKARQRIIDREVAVDFFMKIAEASCEHICIENPVGIMSTRWRKPDQIIQPYQFGDPYEKRTCLWLKGLKPLQYTNVVEPEPRIKYASGKTMPAWYDKAWHLPKEERTRVRSKTFPGIGKAIAEQFTRQIEEQG